MSSSGSDFKFSLLGKIVLPSQVGASALNVRVPTVRIVPAYRQFIHNKTVVSNRIPLCWKA